MTDEDRDREDILASERIQQVDDTPLWTEYFYFFAYDPDAGIGVSIHFGRASFDTSLWRATTLMMLPGDELLVAKTWGRETTPLSLDLGGLTVSCVDPGRLWTIAYHGLAQRTSRRRNLSTVHADGVDERLSFQIAFEGASPCWNMRSSIGDAASYAHMHFEQISRTAGSVSIGDRIHAFAGVGARDHSSGPRDYAKVHGNLWLCALFPDGKAVMLQLIRMEGAETNAGYVSWADGSPLELVKLAELPTIPDRSMPAGTVAHDPLADETLRHFTMKVATSRGTIELEVELLHCCAATWLSPSEELLGTDTARRDALQWIDAAARVRWGDLVGHGVRERIAPMSSLDI